MGMLNRLLKPASRKPLLSLVVVIYKMPEQADNTLFSLSCLYQNEVGLDDYEVIVVENSSDQVLGRERAERHGANFRYFYREEPLPTPVPATLFGVSVARSDLLGLMIDGARMATPGLVEHIIKASRSHENAVVAVPGYHLGDSVQQESLHLGYDEREEAKLLKSIDWPSDGYRLFDIACFSRSNENGFFRPNAECNCLSIPRHIWEAVGGIDRRFTETGGGQANPDLYKRVCEHPGIELVVIPGEGTFHQFHGGVTTGTAGEERERHMQNHFEQYKSLRGSYYESPQTPTRLYGAMPDNAVRFMQRSLERALTSPRPRNSGEKTA